MTVHRLTGVLPWLLSLLLFTGVHGDKSTVYSVGGTATLACKHDVSSDCSSVTWTISNGRNSTELVAHGKVKNKNQETSGKLRVGSDCSLHINNLTIADTGRYHCRLYHNTEEYTDAAVMYLSVLHTFSSTPVTPLKTGSTVQASRTYTTIFSGHTTDEKKSGTDVWIGTGVAVCIAIVLIVIVIMICKRITVQREMAFHHFSQSPAVTDQSKGESEANVTYAVVNPSAAGKRRANTENQESQTEYATIKTSQNSSKP